MCFCIWKQQERNPFASQGNANFVAKTKLQGWRCGPLRETGGVGKGWRSMEEDRSLISTSVGTNCRRFLGDSYTASRSSLLFALRTAPRHRTANTMCGQSASANPGSQRVCLPINTITLMGKTDGPYHYHQRSKDSQAWNKNTCVYNFSERT